MRLFPLSYVLSRVNFSERKSISHSSFTPITGSVAVFYAIKALQCERDGHYEQAFIHSRRSLSWSMATFVIALFIYLTLGLIIFIHTIDHHH